MSTSDWIIRPVSESDAPQLAAIYAPYVAQTAITFEYTVPSAEEFAQRIRKTLEFYPYLAAERDGVLLGYAYAGTFKGRAAYAWSVETTIKKKRYRQEPLPCTGGGPPAAGNHKYERLHRLSAYGKRSVPGPVKHSLSRASGLCAECSLPCLCVKIRPVVRHGLDGEGDRRTPAESVSAGSLQAG